MPGEAFDQTTGADIVEALLIECRLQRPQPRLIFGHCNGAYHGAENHPWRWLSLVAFHRPAEARAADQPAIDADAIGPVDIDRFLRWRVHRECVGERAHPGIERAPSCAQRFLRLQYHGKLCEIETTDMNQRAGAFLRSDAARMGEGVTNLA